MKHIFHLLILALMSTQAAAQELKPVAYADGDQKLNGLITSNSDAKRPGVLLLPAWMGIDDEARTAAIKLAEQGYIVFIADIYGEGYVPTVA